MLYINDFTSLEDEVMTLFKCSPQEPDSNPNFIINMWRGLPSYEVNINKPNSVMNVYKSYLFQVI